MSATEEYLREARKAWNYGFSPEDVAKQLVRKSKELSISITYEDAERQLAKFRKDHPDITDFWNSVRRRIEARSPLDTLQEQQVGLPFEEWRILVVCQLLNMTHGRQVRPMIKRFFEISPSPTRLVEVFEAGGEEMAEVVELLKPLGFIDRRKDSLLRMSKAYGSVDRRGYSNGAWALGLRGCGQYAVDSLNIFRYGILQNVSSDTWLNDYIKWRQSAQGE